MGMYRDIKGLGIMENHMENIIDNEMEIGAYVEDL